MPVGLKDSASRHTYSHRVADQTRRTAAELSQVAAGTSCAFSAAVAPEPAWDVMGASIVTGLDSAGPRACQQR